MKVLRQTTVVHDSQHNAFTDLAYWQGCYWVSYRKGAGHISMDGQATVAVSSDRQRFREVAHSKRVGDCRDPKLLPIDEERMAMIYPSWIKGVPAREMHQFITFTRDGFAWEEPVQVAGIPEHHWMWRIRHHDGLYYGLVKTIGHDPENRRTLYLYISEDLVTWRKHAQVGEVNQGLDEADMLFHEDGTAWILARNSVRAEGTPSSFWCVARAPYAEWEVKEVGFTVQSPVLLRTKGKILMAGRNKMGEFPGDCWPHLNPSSLAVWELSNDFTARRVLQMNAAGDCSYPGLIEDPEGRICMSYYSQHAYFNGDYPRLLREDITPEPVSKPVVLSSANIYFAELAIGEK